MTSSARVTAPAVAALSTPSVSRHNSVSFRDTTISTLSGALVWGVSATEPATFGALTHSDQVAIASCNIVVTQTPDSITITLPPADAYADFSAASIGDQVWVAVTTVNPAVSGTALIDVASAGLLVA